MATGYALDDRGSIPDRGKVFLFIASIPALGPAVSYPVDRGNDFPTDKAAEA